MSASCYVRVGSMLVDKDGRLNISDGGRADDGTGAIRAFPENQLLRRINVFVTVALEDLRKELAKSVRTLGTIEHQ